MSWLNQHFKNFVIPVLGSAPPLPSAIPYFSNAEKTVLKNAWRSVKCLAKGAPILLPGRDVWIFEVLARRENYPTLFLPNCSRLTVKHIQIPQLSEYWILDTGFMGSIPKNLGSSRYVLLSHDHNLARLEGTHQIFPRLKKSRGLALKIENAPKYWRRAFIREGKIYQEFSLHNEFVKAAQLTHEIYTDSSPRFLEVKWTEKPVGVLSAT